MIDALRSFFRSLGAGEAGAGLKDRNEDLRVAAAALLYHVVEADGMVTADEMERLRVALATEFSLSPQQAREAAVAGKAANEEAVDLYSFTSVLKAQLEEDARIRFVELLWDVTFADGAVHELEDNLIWRISDLLGVSTRDRMLAKREAAGRSEVS